MKKILSFLDNYLEEALIGLCMGYFALATFTQVLFRFVFQSPLSWTDETARYAFIWMVFIGAAVAVKKNTHIRVDLLELAIKNEKLKEGLRFVNWLIFLAFSTMATIIGISLCIGLFNFPYSSPALELNMFWVFLSLPVGMGLTTLRIIQSMFKTYIRKDQQITAMEEAV